MCQSTGFAAMPRSKLSASSRVSVVTSVRVSPVRSAWSGSPIQHSHPSSVV